MDSSGTVKEFLHDKPQYCTLNSGSNGQEAVISQYSCLTLAQCFCDHDAFFLYKSGAAKVVV